MLKNKRPYDIICAIEKDRLIFNPNLPDAYLNGKHHSPHQAIAELLREYLFCDPFRSRMPDVINGIIDSDHLKRTTTEQDLTDIKIVDEAVSGFIQAAILMAEMNGDVQDHGFDLRGYLEKAIDEVFDGGEKPTSLLPIRDDCDIYNNIINVAMYKDALPLIDSSHFDVFPQQIIAEFIAEHLYDVYARKRFPVRTKEQNTSDIEIARGILHDFVQAALSIKREVSGPSIDKDKFIDQIVQNVTLRHSKMAL